MSVRRNILIVEDNAMAAKAAKLFFEMLGCEVESINNGEKAIDLIKQNRFYGICMDIGLPTISGIETCEKIRDYEQRNSLKPIPIVAITGNHSPEEINSYKAAGMQGVIEKPFTKIKAEQFLDICKKL